MNYEIEKNIPFPKGKYSKTFNNYPFADMEIGDSFFVLNDKNKGLQNLQSQVMSLAKSFIYHNNKTGWKFKSHQEKKDNFNGIRIWRLE